MVGGVADYAHSMHLGPCMVVCMPCTTLLICAQAAFELRDTIVLLSEEVFAWR